jgi:hypothetical protein
VIARDIEFFAQGGSAVDQTRAGSVEQVGVDGEQIFIFDGQQCRVILP